MKNIYKSIIAAVVFFMAGCDTTELDLTKNPNGLATDEATADLYINEVQVNFGALIASLEVEAAETVRILNMDGRNYQNAFAPTRFDEEWEDSYQKILKDIREMTILAEEAGQLHHIGMAQVIEAYIIVTLVDFFGDIPYEEALQGGANLNPGVAGDGGESVYAAAVTLLDNAITNFNTEIISSLEPSNDLFYSGNWDNWIAAANSIKMKIYVATRLVDTSAESKFNDIVTSGEFITSNSQDFQFEWGISNNNPDTRHPEYITNYTPGGANTYMSNWLMDYMQNDKQNNGVAVFEGPDPRMKYYFYRQTSFVPQDNPNLINCVEETKPDHYGANDVFCSLPEGYWGRDHGDDDGIPPDGQLRTAYGVYPVGGRLDDNSFEVIASISLGAQGAGITPIMLASWVDMMRAEMALIDGNVAVAQDRLVSGVGKSFAKVREFGSRDATADISELPDEDDDVAYQTELAQIFASASSEGERLNILGSEYFVTLFGNGLDGLNYYRRTGRPSTLQPNLEEEPGDFFRSFFYPPVFVERNSAVAQKDGVQDRVFWDTGTTLLAN
ncbi:SusD/RagB family nutrient-binding outer membrane lipoprotein [Fulvivirga aurantia]|uniref:SusD/RagB family nutrient-binding outer membrane lipoprotein n=1 Tax=Fulvivirga aurantia TaxID=2529383 RepID=UPI001629E3A8|nr:SusD/RagB family nutrient-binding outer membrane lipoprotein [Fulvivirga aurantia]